MDQSLSQFILFVITAAGAVIAALWLAIVLWTLRDMRARSRDPLAQAAAGIMVAVLSIFGLVIYLMLRPRETLAEAYERSLEEEALLQGIEEKPVCPGCGRPANANWQVCPSCHTRLKKPCIACGELLDLPWNVCPYCATPQVAASDRSGRHGQPTIQPVVAAMNNYDSTADPESASLEYLDNDEV
ncbi:MAG: zinc ribbon domain-containing protein [Aggregatilineales bacterium]